MKVGFLGPKTSFSHEATKKLFPKEELIAVESIPEIFIEIEEKEVDIGVIPIENSTGGSVSNTLDSMIRSKGLFIRGELYLDIDLSLLANCEMDKIKRIYSHPQPFAQCQQWIHHNVRDLDLVEVSSTAKAAEMASKEEFASAIASKNAAKNFGLKIVSENIQDIKDNNTRFVIIGREELEAKGKEKTSIVVALKNKPGALFDSLQPFKEHGVDLTKIESRPSKKASWDYVFFIEFKGNMEEERVKNALEEMKESTTNIRSFGSYNKIE